MNLHKSAVLLILGIILVSCLACNGTTTEAPPTTPAITSLATPNANWVGPDGETLTEYVPVDGGYWYGADGHYIELINNLSARDPNWQTLREFLMADRTDLNIYNTSTFECEDYAEMLHNNAEAAGIRAALVSVELNDSKSDSDRTWWFLINAFNVSDKGLAYLNDCGASWYCGGDCHLDKEVYRLTLNLSYESRYLFEHAQAYLYDTSSYIVKNVSIYWGEAEREYAPVGGYESGADGHLIQLANNPQAADPSWQELKDFLKQDDTDTYLYNSSTFVCTDYAEMLHNNAEEAGIRAAFVTIDFVNESTGHALNAFNTSDTGLVYIDDTGGYSHQPCSGDKKVDLKLEEAYNPIQIFPCEGAFSTAMSDYWGNISVIHTQW